MEDDWCPLQETKAAPLSFRQPKPCHKPQLLTVNKLTLFCKKGGKCKLSSCFQQNTKSQILPHSSSLRKKISHPTQILQCECVLSKKEVVEQWARRICYPNSGIPLKSPPCSPARVPAAVSSPWPGHLRPKGTGVSAAAERGSSDTAALHGHTLLRQRNNPTATTYQSVYEDFSSFFTLMESIYISQLLKQVHHGYGNMCRC